MTNLEQANKSTVESAEALIEDGVANVYIGLFRLRNAGLYQEEYDSMGALLNMLQQDRQHMREKYKVEGQ